MKNFLIVVCVVVVVCLLGYAGQYMDDGVQQVNTVANTQKQNTPSSKPSKVTSTSNNKNSNTSEKVNTQVKEEEKKVEDKKEEEKVENKENVKTEEPQKEKPVVEENSISSEDKAIQLAKKTYGNSSDVYFKIEQIVSNGVYIISVRDNETTEAYAWYSVDVNSGVVK